MEIEEIQTMSSAMSNTLRKTAGWINFFVVALYIISGFIFLALILMMSQRGYPPYMREVFLGVGIIAIGLIVFVAVQLTKYMKGLKEAATEKNVNLITKGLQGYKNYFMTSAILLSLAFALMLLGFMAALSMR